MRIASLILGLAFCFAAVAANGQESPPRESWERILADEAELIELVRALKVDLEAADVSSLARQFQPGKLRLVMRQPELSHDLHAHSQVKALLADFLRHRSALDLRISLARLEQDHQRVHIALDALGSQFTGGRARRDRFVAVYRMMDGDWKLSELRCP